MERAALGEISFKLKTGEKACNTCISCVRFYLNLYKKETKMNTFFILGNFRSVLLQDWRLPLDEQLARLSKVE